MDHLIFEGGWKIWDHAACNPGKKYHAKRVLKKKFLQATDALWYSVHRHLILLFLKCTFADLKEHMREHCGQHHSDFILDIIYPTHVDFHQTET